MQRRQPTLRLAAQFALRHPATAARLAFEDKQRLVTIAANALPGPLRRASAGVIGGPAGWFARRPGKHARAISLWARAMAAQGDRARALATIEAAGRGATTGGAAALARAALDLGDPGLADALLPPHRAAAASSDRDLRGRIAFAMGRYRDARGLVGGTGRSVPRRTSALARRLDGELALMDPAWDAPSLRERVSPTTGPSTGAPTVLHLLTNSLPYRQAGYTLRAQAVARCQRDAGLDPQMVTRAGFPGNEGLRSTGETDVVEGVRYHRIRPDLPPDLAADEVADATALGVLQLAGTLRPAVIQPTTNYVNAQAALAAGSALGIPVVYEVRGFLEETWLSAMSESHVGEAAVSAAIGSDRYVMTRAIETACMMRADAVVTLSETMRADIVARGVDAAKVAVIPNAVDVDRFTPGPRDEALAAAHGIAAHETVIGYVSSLVPYEGIRYLIDAVALLVDAGEAVRLLVVGDGTELEALLAQAVDRGLLQRHLAIFPGRVPFKDIDRYHRLIDVFVVPRTNTRVSRLVTPLKPYEAMAMARAMVVSDVPALTEIVRDGETGRVFTAEDPAALASVLSKLIEDPAERARLGAAARAWVVAERTWASNGQRYRALYGRLGVA